MLIEINSPIFRNGSIEFHKGLNVILGDDNASNSIGKSTLLMIIDFIFGGNTYEKFNKDVAINLGNHAFTFCFEFEGQKFRFKRQTEDSQIVYKCDKDYKIVDNLEIEKYTEFLKNKYGIDNQYMTFRSVVSLYSRVWGKENYDIKRPLDSFKNAKTKDMVESLIKLFDKYDKIYEISQKIIVASEEKNTLNKAAKYKYIPDINKSKYKINLIKIDEIDTQINKIESQISLYAINITELLNEEMIELNRQKDELLGQKSIYVNRLKRLDIKRLKSSNINSKDLDKLSEFFPNINMQKIEEIEMFHSKLTQYLNNSIKQEQKELEDKIELLELDLEKTNDRIFQVTKNKDIPKYIIESIVKLNDELSSLKQENEFYNRKQNIASKLNDMKDELNEKSSRIVQEIQVIINEEISNMLSKISSKEVKPPKLILSPEKYSFEINDNTGTGNAYQSLIILDISIFKVTKLPFIIHDSMLFKNIQQDTMQKLIYTYNSFEKQVFIAIDEKYKFDKQCQEILGNKKVVELDKENTLFNKIWNKIDD